MTEWTILPNDKHEHWLLVDMLDQPWLVRVYKKDGRAWMVRNGHRQRIVYGLWTPMRVPIRGCVAADLTELLAIITQATVTRLEGQSCTE